MGGVLCPRERCGMGMLPENPGRQVTCPECRVCHNTYNINVILYLFSLHFVVNASQNIMLARVLIFLYLLLTLQG